MREVVIKRKELTLEDLQGDEIVAYQCSNSRKVAVLARLGPVKVEDDTVPVGYTNYTNYTNYNNGFGFIPFGETNSRPRFVDKTFHQAVERAGRARKVLVFDNLVELLEWVLTLIKHK